MPFNTNIKFNPARKPRVSQPKVPRLKHRVNIQKLMLIIFIVKRPKSAPKLRQKNSPDMVIFNRNGVKFPRFFYPVVAVLHFVGQNCLNHTLAKVLFFTAAYPVGCFKPGVYIANIFNIRHRAFIAQVRRRQHKFKLFYHFTLSFPQVQRKRRFQAPCGFESRSAL